MEYQCTLLNTPLAPTCALSGHRLLKSDFDENRLRKELIRLIEQEKIITFYCGMAVGFDLVACEQLLSLQQRYPQIKVVACVPCPEQDKHYSPADKEKYLSLLERCDRKELVSPHYFTGCMQRRNQFMVDNAGILLSYCNQKTGGTASTVRYAQKKGIPVIFV